MAATFSVVSQRPYVDFTPDGQQRQYVAVTIEIPSGSRQTINVPGNLYSHEYVKAQAEDLAATMIAVENL